MKNLLDLVKPAARVQTSMSSKDIALKMLQAMRESAIVADKDTYIICSNDVAYKEFARFGKPLENFRISEVFRDVLVHESFRKALEKGESSEINFEFFSDEKRTYKVFISPLEMNNERYAIGIFYNITQLERLEKIRQEFLENVSHELRTPLTSILASVETLESGAIEDPVNNRKFLSVIRKNAERMHHLIDDILELSSIESGRIRVHFQDVVLRKVVCGIFTDLASKAEDKKVRLKQDIPESVCVFADAVRLEQMLTNLIDNAIKFNREGGLVEVSHRQNETSDIISVSDTGEGIPPEHLSRIFERFYRVDKARSRKVGGTGLGLAIVKHLAKLHGGEVRASSIPGRGSTFFIELPKRK
jgi:two-component system, OmpR family, phosphate regulon sensor histidine kinase PhoR